MMNDYYEIALTRKSRRVRLRVPHTVKFHRESRDFMDGFLGRHGGSRTVVVTHHAPSRHSIANHFANDLSSAAFASDLAGLIIERGPELWVHGHVHERHYYKLGKTRVLCNPRGYPNEPGFADFDFAKVVEV
jgi:Icc-related predicted phosphoesterase